MDVDPVADGNLVLETNLLQETVVRVVQPGTGTHRTHFASCQFAGQHRHPRHRRRRAGGSS
ncbi:hypothetical protein [Euzebya rosea]|uniref:hypothetical protein n=1 Tax=Euzebya rosea TaxID=2052804 RepID=UPI000D3E767A|nr:hypothetical protein [Euzebya rosea]